MTNRTDAFAAMQRSLTRFSGQAIGVPLYDYQALWADYALTVVAERRNETITVEMPRQSGKNETSAQLEVLLLARFARRGGSIVKTAPTWKPQIVNSKLRFDARAKMATQRLTWLTFKPSMGYIYRCGRADIQFLSADPAASVVGATASLLLEVDEAQDVDKAKFDKDFSPMRASTGAPIVAYGTTWTTDTLLERFKADVSEGRSRGRIFRILPDLVADANPRYGDFVDAEVRRLGRSHPFIATQYFLEPLPGAGRMLSQQHLRLILGDHQRQDRRQGEAQIVAGLDFAGADELAGELVSLTTSSARDSVALTIGAVTWVRLMEGLNVPHICILARYEWVNVNPVTLHNVLYEILWNRWKVDRVHCDATGIGATGTAFLAQAINKPGRPERVIAITYDSAWNTQTELAFNYLAAINNGHLLDYQPGFDALAVAGQERADESDPERHAWWQRGHARLEAKPSRRVHAYVPDSEGHDDLLNSELLMVGAAYAVGQTQAMKSATVDWYAAPVGSGEAQPIVPARSTEEIERMLDEGRA